MGVFDVHCSVSGLALQGSTRLILLAAQDSGLDFLASTEHAEKAFANARPQLTASRKLAPGLILLAGIEWNIPAGGHVSVVVEQSPEEWSVLREFAQAFDRKVNPELLAKRESYILLPDAGTKPMHYFLR